MIRRWLTCSGTHTESYDLLCKAVVVQQCISEEEVQETYWPASQPGQSAAEKFDPHLTDGQILLASVLNISPITALRVIHYARVKGIDTKEDAGRLAFAPLG